jgi:antibiotic biosynthesis monooxygenase (ABM) superfamily enzyme
VPIGGENKAGEQTSEVTAVVNIKINPGCEKEYDEWLRGFLVLVKKVPGYLGTTTINETGTDSSARHIIHRFRDKVSLEAWENSQELHELAEEGNKYSTPYLQKATGLETWFNIPDLKANVTPPPKWKMAIVAFIGAYCISSLASFILRPYLGLQPLLFNLFMTIILVTGLTYFAMPLLSRLLRRWLYPINI